LRETGGKDRALSWFERAVKLSPANLDFRAEYARALLLNLQTAEAEQEARAVLKEQATHLRASETLAALLLAQRKPAEARRIYQQILQREPDHLPSLEAMQQLATASGDAASATLFQQRIEAIRKRNSSSSGG
jgi:Tfp pilus assembly protein PilF